MMTRCQQTIGKANAKFLTVLDQLTETAINILR